MSTSTVNLDSARGRVLVGATQVFHDSGFHAATMSAIGAAAGVTGAATYRHYAGKNELLAAVVAAGTDVVDAALAQVEVGGTLAETAVGMAAALARPACDHPLYGTIIQRDTRSLAPEQREAARQRWQALQERLSQAVVSPRARQQPEGPELLARAAFAVAASPSYLRAVRPSSARDRELMGAMVHSVLTSDRLGRAGAHPVEPDQMATERMRDRATRREAIMSVATRLFARRGFHGVSMEDIAEQVGVTVPTLYSHFDDKATLMLTALERGTALLQLLVARAVELHPDPSERLRAILDSYARFATDFPDFVAIVVHDLVPIERFRDVRRAQHDYVEEIVRPLRHCRPDLDDHMRRLLVHGALGVVNELTRTTRYLARPDLQSELSALAIDVCLSDVTGSGATG